MNKFSQRSESLEIMDDLNCSGEVVHQTLIELAFINRWLGGNAITIRGVEEFLGKKPKHPITIADVGCGSGDMLRLIKPFLQGKDIDAQLIGIDANPHIIAYANDLHKDIPGISFRADDIRNESFRSDRYDVMLATLFLHHFTTPELIGILQSMKKQVRLGIVINDLHRHPLAYYSIRLLTLIFSKSAMVKFDAPLSVLRGFTRKEWIEILEKAGIHTYTIKWKWAFRWQIVIPA